MNTLSESVEAEAHTQDAPPAVHRPTWNVGLVSIADVRPSALNPRRHFDAERHADLMSSILKNGVLQPIIVRHAVGTSDEQDDLSPQLEIVAGERRWRAAKEVGLAEIPAIVRDLTDLEALEIAVIENLQRSDLHPLEEAEGYEKLMESLTVDEIADKIGKSRAYVYARMKLCALCPDARTAFYDGKLTPSTALLVARIPSSQLQKSAIKELWDTYDKAPRSFRVAAGIIRRRFMLALGDAPFPTEDETLLAGVGACAMCPKRSGSQPELFPDTKETDLCTDPECFTKKRDACTARQVAAAKKVGIEVIKGKKAREMLPYEHSQVKGHIKLDDKCYDDPKHRTYRKILGKDAPPPTAIVVTHEGGVAVEIVRVNDQLKKALEAKGVKSEKAAAKTPEQKASDAKAKLAARIEEETRWRTWLSIRAARQGLTSEGAPLTGAEKLRIFEHMWNRAGFDLQLVLAKVWGWPTGKDVDQHAEWLVRVEEMPQRLDLLDIMLLDITMARLLAKAPNPSYEPDPLPGLAELHQVDMQLIAATVETELTPKTKAKTTAKAMPEKDAAPAKISRSRKAKAQPTEESDA